MATKLKALIKDVILWSDLDLEERIFDLPSPMTKAWFMLKLNEDDADTNALISKEITATPVAGQGHIDDTGADGIGHVIFSLTATELGTLRPDQEYFFGMKALLANGKVGEFKSGSLLTVSGIVKRIL